MPAHPRGAAVVTAGDLFVQFSNFRLSNCAQKSGRDGKRIKKVMLASEPKVVIANGKNRGIFCHTTGVAFSWESLTGLDKDAPGRCTRETQVKKCER